MRDVFDKWNKDKKSIDGSSVLLEFKLRDIWFIRMGKNIGFEQDGKGDELLRPVLVLKKFNKRLFWGIPMTSKSKYGKYYYTLNSKRNNTVILSQLRLYDAKRLKYKIGTCTGVDFEIIKDRIKIILENEEHDTT